MSEGKASRLPDELLRFTDLSRVGINNWPTLKRRIAHDNFPQGRYLGEGNAGLDGG